MRGILSPVISPRRRPRDPRPARPGGPLQPGPRVRGQGARRVRRLRVLLPVARLLRRVRRRGAAAALEPAPVPRRALPRQPPDGRLLPRHLAVRPARRPARLCAELPRAPVRRGSRAVRARALVAGARAARKPARRGGVRVQRLYEWPGRTHQPGQRGGLAAGRGAGARPDAATRLAARRRGARGRAGPPDHGRPSPGGLHDAGRARAARPLARGRAPTVAARARADRPRGGDGARARHLRRPAPADGRAVQPLDPRRRPQLPDRRVRGAAVATAPAGPVPGLLATPAHHRVLRPHRGRAVHPCLDRADVRRTSSGPARRPVRRAGTGARRRRRAAALSLPVRLGARVLVVPRPRPLAARLDVRPVDPGRGRGRLARPATRGGAHAYPRSG